MKQLILAFGLTVAILVAIVGFSLWVHNRPESSGKFEVTGTFVSAVVDGKQKMPSSDGFINQTIFLKPSTRVFFVPIFFQCCILDL